MRAVDRGTVAGDARREAVALGAAHERAEVRDLFERFVPESERVARLGDTFDPAAVLALPGDARRGREVFVNSAAAQCKTCHRLDGAGEPLGPDLSKIGAKYTRAEMLTHILEPSRSIDPQFATYVLETKDGKVYTGLLASRTEKEVVLKDAQNRTARVPAAEVEQMLSQSRSLMPELLLRDLTAGQAADLLAYLASLK
jgi:putative heme-binding domain-containing protein